MAKFFRPLVSTLSTDNIHQHEHYLLFLIKPKERMYSYKRKCRARCGKVRNGQMPELCLLGAADDVTKQGPAGRAPNPQARNPGNTPSIPHLLGFLQIVK